MITEANAIESLLRRFCQSIKDHHTSAKDIVDRCILDSKHLTKQEKTLLQGLVAFGAIE